MFGACSGCFEFLIVVWSLWNALYLSKALCLSNASCLGPVVLVYQPVHRIRELLAGRHCQSSSTLSMHSRLQAPISFSDRSVRLFILLLNSHTPSAIWFWIKAISHSTYARTWPAIFVNCSPALVTSKKNGRHLRVYTVDMRT